MLDQLPDTDLEVRPKSTAQSGDVEGSSRHIPQEDLEAYATGRLPSGRLSYCRTHLESCDACRAELEDLRAFNTDLSGLSRTESSARHEPRRTRRRGNLALHVTASLTTVVVAGVSAVVWWKHESPTTASKTPIAVPVAESPVAQSPVAHFPGAQSPIAQPRAAQSSTTVPTLRGPTHDARLAEEIAALPDEVRSAVSGDIQQGKLQLPADVTRIRGRAPGSPAVPESNTGFALLTPFGEAISDQRPQFSWQPLPGAIGYSVTIVDTGLHPVQRSPALRATAWRPRRPLHRGQTYLWQVTATLHGGSKVVASRPSPSEAHLRIIPLKLAEEIEHFRQGYQEAHLVLGALYGRAGMLTESANELSKIQPDDPTYNTARALLKSLSAP